MYKSGPNILSRLAELERRLAHLEANPVSGGAGSGVNADMVDSLHAASFLGASATATDSDKVDGLHASATTAASKLLALTASQTFVPGGDVLPAGDVQGLMKRIHNGTVPQYPFDSALATFAWSAAAGFVTPASVSIADSQLKVGFGTGQGTSYACLYLTTKLSWYIRVRAAMAYGVTGNYMGPCMMDDAADNVVATVIRRAADGTRDLCKVTRTGGGAWAVTALLTGLLPGSWYVPTLGHYGTEWSSWTANHEILVDATTPEVVSTSGAHTWTPTRKGILLYTAETTDATTWRTFHADYFHSAA